MSIMIVTTIRPLVLSGLVLASIGFGGFGAATVMVDMPGAVMAGGVVKPDGHRRTVQHLEGGLIETILVREGDHVQAGQPLVALDTTRAKANLAILRAARDRQVVKKARLEAEIRLAGTLSLPAPILASPEGRLMAAGEQQLFEARRLSLDGQVAVLEARERQLSEALAGLEAQRNAARAQLESRRAEHKRLQGLADTAVIPRTRIEEIDREIGRLEGVFGNASAQIEVNSASRAEAALQAAQARTTYRQTASDALADTLSEAAELDEKVRVAEDSLARSTILAPVAGTVQDMRVFTPGGVIQPAEPLLDIVPASDQLVIEAEIPVTAVDDMHPGLTAELRFPGIHDRNMQLVAGRVSRISADAVTDEKRGVSFYSATIRVDTHTLPHTVARALQPGLPVDAIIITEPRTLGDYLLEPIRAALKGAMTET